MKVLSNKKKKLAVLGKLQGYCLLKKTALAANSDESS